jgi:hypothetical protein
VQDTPETPQHDQEKIIHCVNPWKDNETRDICITGRQAAMVVDAGDNLHILANKTSFPKGQMMKIPNETRVQSRPARNLDLSEKGHEFNERRRLQRHFRHDRNIKTEPAIENDTVTLMH